MSNTTFGGSISIPLCSITQWFDDRRELHRLVESSFHPITTTNTTSSADTWWSQVSRHLRGKRISERQQHSFTKITTPHNSPSTAAGHRCLQPYEGNLADCCWWFYQTKEEINLKLEKESCRFIQVSGSHYTRLTYFFFVANLYDCFLTVVHCMTAILNFQFIVGKSMPGLFKKSQMF